MNRLVYGLVYALVVVGLLLSWQWASPTRIRAAILANQGGEQR